MRVTADLGSFEAAYTGVYAELVNYDTMYEAVSDRVILLNNFNMQSEEDRERLNRLLYVEYANDTLDTVPSCDCGNVRGEFHVGHHCVDCGTVVATITERPIESILWVKVPEGVRSFISPVVWLTLNDVFKYRTVQIVRWLCDRTYKTKVKLDHTDPLIAQILATGWKGRGINEFIEHFDDIMQVLLNHRGSNALVSPVARKRLVERYLQENRHLFFPKYLPIPNRLIFITEKTSMGIITDPLMYPALDAVRTVTSMDSGIIEASAQRRENGVVKVVSQLGEYYNDYTANNLGKKPGMFRRQKYGSRLDTSARAVIAPITGEHEYDDLHFPWRVGVAIFKTHITSKLLRRINLTTGHLYTPGETEELIMLHTTRYHPLLDEIMQELIAECPYKGLPVIFQRNPSLVRGSAQLMYVVLIKTDPDDATISMSSLALKAANADYDGDEMNASSLIDQKEHDDFKPMAPEYGVMDTNVPFRISGNVGVPGPVMSTISNWLHESE